MKSLLTIFAIHLTSISFVNALPLMFTLKSATRKCISYDIPPNHNGHVAFMALDMEEDEAIQLFATKMVTKAINLKDDEIHEMEVTTPKFIMDKFKTPRGFSKVTTTLTSPSGNVLAENRVEFAHPSILRNIKTMNNAEEDELDLEGMYEVCFLSRNTKDVHILYFVHLDIGSHDGDEQVDEDLWADDFNQDTNPKDPTEKRKNLPAVTRSKHFKPLLTMWGDVGDDLKTVMDELEYIRNRERRMRKTTESTEKRVHHLSMASLIVLVLVTIFQLYHMKTFFKKKKIL